MDITILTRQGDVDLNGMGLNAICRHTVKRHASTAERFATFYLTRSPLPHLKVLASPRRISATSTTSKKKYVGTWVDSITNHLWLYEGTVDQSGNKLTLEAEGPNFMADGKLTKFRDAYEFTSPDHIIVSSSMLGEDGKWITFMTGESTRKKASAK